MLKSPCHTTFFQLWSPHVATLPDSDYTHDLDGFPDIPDDIGVLPSEDPPNEPAPPPLPDTMVPPSPRPSSPPARPSQPGAAPTIPRGCPSLPPPVPVNQEIQRLRALVAALERGYAELLSHDVVRRIPLLGVFSGPQNPAIEKLRAHAVPLLEEGNAAVKFWGDVLVAPDRALLDLESGTVPYELQRSMHAVVALVRKLRSS